MEMLVPVLLLVIAVRFNSLGEVDNHISTFIFSWAIVVVGRHRIMHFILFVDVTSLLGLKANCSVLLT